jgi:hypothetical protein
MSRQVTGWKLDRADRARLLEQFPPRFGEIVADHVTLRFGTDADTPLPSATSGEVVGHVDDGAGVEALVVRIGGATDRGDGGVYHITWSLGRLRRAKESNDVIALLGWHAVEPLIPIRLVPGRWAV